MCELKPKVLLVDDDPAMLLLISKWLGTSNYEIRTATDANQGMERIREECPDVLITDWDMPGASGLNLVRWLRQQELPKYVYTLLLTVRCGKSDIVQGFEAGVDDFLKKPVDKDELVARMLSGKRVIGLEQQLRSLSRTDSLTGLMNQATFLAHLEMEWGRATRLPIPMSCVMIEVDHLREVESEEGRPVYDEVLRNVAKMIQSHTRVSDGVCRFVDDTIAVLLAETNETNSLLWAERIQGQIEGAEFPLSNGRKLTLTANFGVAERQSNTASATELIDHALLALRQAEEVGADRIVAYRAALPIYSVEVPSVTDTFEHLVARDIMSPVVPRLRETDTVGRVLSFFLRFHLTEAPVVDAQRRCIGRISKRDLMSATLHEHWPRLEIRQLVQTNMPRFTESTPALELYGHFCRTNDQSAVILRNERPTGMVYRKTMLAQLSNACQLLRPSVAEAKQSTAANPAVVQPC